MRLPSTFKGCSTIELLEQWDRVTSGTADGSGNATAGIMNEFLTAYRLCPTSWSRMAWKEDKARARQMKDAGIVTDIERNAAGHDEISSLAAQVSSMILELENYMTSLKETTHALGREKLRADAMVKLANKDALTGIRNKTAYDKEVKRRARRGQGTPLSLAGRMRRTFCAARSAASPPLPAATD